MNNIEIVISIFTVSKGSIKTLLTIEDNDNLYYLVRDNINSPCNIENKVKEIIKKQTKINNTDIYLSKVYGKTDKMYEGRLVSLSYIAITNEMELNLQNEWLDIDMLPNVMAYDYKEILNDSISKLKEIIFTKNAIKILFNNRFTIPELQKIKESIDGKKIDRRNFYRKMIKEEKIIDTNEYRLFEGRKKAKVYKYE